MSSRGEGEGEGQQDKVTFHRLPAGFLMTSPTAFPSDFPTGFPSGFLLTSHWLS